MTPAERALQREIHDALLVPGGVLDALAERASTSLVIVRTLENYISTEVHAGTELGAFPLFEKWTTFNNSTVRALVALLEAQGRHVAGDDTRKVLDALTATPEGVPSA